MRTESRLAPSRLRFHPLTPARWNDLVTLFGPRGGCAGCWCMWWKLPRSKWSEGKGEKNRDAMKKIVMSGVSPGILAYEGDEPVGWCALEPRDNYPGLDRARTLKRIDDQPVWSVSCFFVKKSHRRRGLSVALLGAASKFARKNRAKILEGYPVVVRNSDAPPPFIWTGTESAFKRAGFVAAARPPVSRCIMRKTLR